MTTTSHSPRLVAQPQAKVAAPVYGGVLQRQCACGQHAAGGECEECRKKKQSLQRKEASGAEPVGVPPIVHEVLRSPGQPLDAAARGFMESRFSHDFSQVRVHTDTRAAESARVVHALAYTVGHDVAFAPGQYAPGTAAGRRLLAHELTHVVQQSSRPIGWSGPLVIGASKDASEQEADEFAARIQTDRPAPLPTQLAAQRRLMTPKLQRQGSSQEGRGTPSACVVSERIPATRSGIINRGGTVGERFGFNIDWMDSGPEARGGPTSYCDCACGEYRQYVKGHLIINGNRETWPLWGGAVLEENVYHEDGTPRSPYAHYGHRHEPLTMDEDFLPDRATGCSYRGRDFPRVMIGSDVDVLFQFKGQSYDACNDTFGPIHEWEFRYIGSINYGP